MLLCRDVDAYSFDLAPAPAPAPAPQQPGLVVVAALPGRDDRPASCDPVPRSACAVTYDSSSCSGGWKLVVAPGQQLRFRWFTSTWQYRNDMDTVGENSSLPW